MKYQGNNSILNRDIFCILGLPFDAVNLSEAIALVTSDIENNQRCFLTTPNLNFLITAQSNLSFFQSVVDSDLIIADGMPIIWIAKLLGISLTERVAGSDLFDELSRQNGRNKKTSVFFFGGQEWAGTIKRVDFWKDNWKYLANDTKKPYEHTINNLSAGKHILRTRLIYTNGKKRDSKITITIEKNNN